MTLSTTLWHINLRNSFTETQREALQTFLERKGLKHPFGSILDYLQLKKVGYLYPSLLWRCLMVTNRVSSSVFQMSSFASLDVIVDYYRNVVDTVFLIWLFWHLYLSLCENIFYYTELEAFAFEIFFSLIEKILSVHCLILIYEVIFQLFLPA